MERGESERTAATERETNNVHYFSVLFDSKSFRNRRRGDEKAEWKIEEQAEEEDEKTRGRNWR